MNKDGILRRYGINPAEMLDDEDTDNAYQETRRAIKIVLALGERIDSFRASVANQSGKDYRKANYAPSEESQAAADKAIAAINETFLGLWEDLDAFVIVTNYLAGMVKDSDKHVEFLLSRTENANKPLIHSKKSLTSDYNKLREALINMGKVQTAYGISTGIDIGKSIKSRPGNPSDATPAGYHESRFYRYQFCAPDGSILPVGSEWWVVARHFGYSQVNPEGGLRTIADFCDYLSKEYGFDLDDWLDFPGEKLFVECDGKRIDFIVRDMTEGNN